MADSQTSTLRLTQPTVGGDSGTWADSLNNNWKYVDEAVSQAISVNIAGLSTYTLTADGSASDQARYALVKFTGALTGECTVTLPANQRIFRAQNSTTGSQNVKLTTGSGDTLTLPPNGFVYSVICDGTNVDQISAAIDIGLATTATSGLVSLGTLSNLSSSSAVLTVENDSGAAAEFMAAAAADDSVLVRKDATTGALISFLFSSTAVGSITTNDSSVAYNTTSDARLKEEAGLLDGASEILDRLKPRWFRWKDADDRAIHPGFFAQELHEIWHWATTPGAGEPGEDGFKPWQTDDGKLMPLVVAALQEVRKEARKEITELRQRIAVLEGSK